MPMIPIPLAVLRQQMSEADMSKRGNNAEPDEDDKRKEKDKGQKKKKLASVLYPKQSSMNDDVDEQ